MPYLSDWEMLSHAVERLSVAGASLDAAKADLVAAIADRKVQIRFEISQTDPDLPLFGVGELMLGEGVLIPAHLQVSDFDWDTFCPSEWWRSANTATVRYKFKWLEVRRDGVTRYLLSLAANTLLGGKRLLMNKSAPR
ncbi:MAG: hypothetical protein H0U98_14355 [Alphaproteobacteria bacterium]|nr:hypothetical protein [Alphaproteobacteria bacterium]